MSIRRNTIYNLAGSVAPIVVALLVIPVYLNIIGEARYGVLALAWLLLGYFGLFDLGLGRATAQRIAVLNDSPARERSDLFWTALILNLGLGLLGGLIIWPVAFYFFSQVFNIQEALRLEVMATIPWLALSVPLSTLSGVLTGALQGREKFFELNLISSIDAVLFQVTPLVVAAVWTADLGVLLPAAVIARLSTLFALFLVCRYRIAFGHPISFVRTKAIELLQFGGWVTVTSFVGPAMVILDRLVIGTLSGASAVSYYTVPFQLAERTTLLSSSLVSALFPRFVSSSKSEETRLAIKGFRMLLIVTTPILSVGVILVEPFLGWWIDRDFADQASPIGQIILVGFWINGFAKIPYAQLQATGHPDLVAKCHLMELLPYLGLLFFAVENFGLIGAAITFSVRVIVDFVLLSSFAGMLKLTIRLLFTPALIMVIALWIAQNASFDQLMWVVGMILYLVFVMSWAWYQAPSSQKKYFLGLLNGSFF